MDSHIRCRIAVAALLLCVIAAFQACGWQGEVVPEVIPNNGLDTAINDRTYTVVTGNVSSLSAVAVDLNGYVNAEQSHEREFEEFGFIVSRFEENATYKKSQTSEACRHDCVRRYAVKDVGADNAIKTRVYGLIPATKFFYRTYAVRKNGEVLYGVMKHFKTIDLKVTIYTPRRVGIRDVDFEARIDGLGGTDYGKAFKINFICRDIPVLFEDRDTMTYNRVEASAEGRTRFLRTATFDNLRSGRAYYVHAYAEIESDFYDYDIDNIFNEYTRRYAYGAQPSDVRRYKYLSQRIAFSANALVGVKAFTNGDVAFDYDVVDIMECFFFLPSDTLHVDGYGVALILTSPRGDKEYVYYPSTDELRQGNRYDVRIENLDLNTQYIYTAYVDVEGQRFTSVDIRSFTTLNYTPEPVDLGLSVLWADRNIGAHAPEASGAFYSWGEMEPKKSYFDSDYVGPDSRQTDIGGGAYDVATAKWGGTWRLPSTEHIEELFERCDWRWAELNGKSGYMVVGPNDNYIFLPAAGIISGTEKSDEDRYGYYWTSQRAEAATDMGLIHNMYFRSGIKANKETMPIHRCLPSLGMPVRPICNR